MVELYRYENHELTGPLLVIEVKMGRLDGVPTIMLVGKQALVGKRFALVPLDAEAEQAIKDCHG